MSFTDNKSRPTDTRIPEVRITNMEEEDEKSQDVVQDKLEQDAAPNLEQAGLSDEGQDHVQQVI